MSNDFSELDSIIETDILEALGEPIPETIGDVLEENLEVEDGSIDSEENLDLESLVADLTPEVEEEPTTNFEDIEDIINTESEDESEAEVDPKDEIASDEEVSFDNEVIEIDESEILPLHEIESAIEEQESIQSDQESINIDSSGLATLLSQLLNNKTIEITIKVKD